MISEAIGVIEFLSVARGIEATDKMLKAAEVKVLKTSTVCPGKYLTIVYGRTASVKSSMQTAIREGGEFVVDTLELHNVHPQVVPAMAQASVPENPGALGIMEFYSVTSYRNFYPGGFFTRLIHEPEKKSHGYPGRFFRCQLGL